ncbi:hypothetical protein EWM64_g3708 [Hericium alpestre]|uniref:VHS domain-containing protein n=1 Tax=Hericium alpestre TaxID=135208 RepID=A0A4Z0A1T1_9AGAM|nr:hypothetical protein EWM64_g3708 [Hericium alpestre]
MAAISFAKSAAAALSREKPRSSITEWIDILTGPGYDDESYDGPTEASRAIRKKLKHGNPHQQYRALVILKALVENCGTKFQTTFADGHLTDAMRNLATDSATDAKVKKKTISVLASWHNQFKDDRSMQTVAGLYRQCRPADTEHRARVDREREEREQEYERRRQEEKSAKEEAKRRAKLEKEAEKERERERLKQAAETKKKRSSQQPITRRKEFNFEQEKPQVLNSIANASSAANNLLNAITLVNTEHDSLQSNERVQECIARVKQSRKQIVRYIQLVEDEEFIGTLIETNERIIHALETFDKLSKPNVTEKDVEEVQQGMAAAHIEQSEVRKLQEKQRAAVQRAARYREQDHAHEEDDDPPSSAGLHPDLQDLSFGTLGKEKSRLPPPIRPTIYGSDDDQLYKRGSLSDFSDYESSNEDAHTARAGSSKLAPVHYTTVSEDDLAAKNASQKKHDEEDPFADPFAD